jgi:Cys-rich repeat protein
MMQARFRRVLLFAARAGLGIGFGALCCNLYEGRTLELFPELVSAGAECRGSEDCPRERALCARGLCLECLVDGDCDRGRLACVGNVCVECRSADNCANGEDCNLILSECAATCGAPSDCAGQVASRCSGELDLCVQCLEDGDCAEPRNPACAQGGRCVECLADVHCPGDRPRCQVSLRTCVECTDSSQCGERVCDPRDSRCVDCLTDTDCGSGESCDVDRRRCRLPCGAAPDCEPKKPFCDEASALCVECNVAGDCTDKMRPACSLEHQCVECTDDSQCQTPNKPACITATDRCGECTSDEHCAGATRCDLAAARCVPAAPGPVPDAGVAPPPPPPRPMPMP